MSKSKIKIGLSHELDKSIGWTYKIQTGLLDGLEASIFQVHCMDTSYIFPGVSYSDGYVVNR